MRSRTSKFGYEAGGRIGIGEFSRRFQEADENNKDVRYGMQSYVKTQLHLVARNDDTAHIFTNTLNMHSLHDSVMTGMYYYFILFT